MKLKMRHLVSGILFIVLLVFLNHEVNAGVGGSKHDMSIFGSSNFSGTFIGDNDETCVYCHTPHASYGSQTPLWNKNLASPARNFTVYSSPTMNTTPSNPPSTISMLCLSCHDGVTAINALLNAPGSGNPAISATGSDQIGDLGPLAKWVNIGDGDPSTGAPYAIDLSDDHPVSIDYTTVADGVEFVLSPVGVNLVNNQFVECTSCHDPHNGTPDGIGGSEFMIMSNASSALCFACHIK